MDRSAADLVDVMGLEAFFESWLYKQMKQAKVIYRERRFNVMLPAKDFTQNKQLANKLEEVDSRILIQGVIDCFFELDDGSICVVDYKTDRVLAERSEAVSLLRERYKNQLSYYKRACEIITGKDVSKTLLWSFGLCDVVEIEN